MPDLLSSWTSDSATSPRLTWYGRGSSRIELSGHVLATWTIKTTQALQDLADAGAGTRVLLDLPPHWRTVTWALGTWTAGATVVLPATSSDPSADGGEGRAADGQDVDVVVTADPQQWSDLVAAGVVVLAQELGDLALSWQGEPLQPGVIDANAEVMGYPDRVDSVPIPASSDPALVAGQGGQGTVAFAGLATWASGLDQERLLATTHRTGGHPARVLAAPDSLEALLGTAIAVYGNRGSLVVVPPQMDDATRQGVIDQESVAEIW